MWHEVQSIFPAVFPSLPLLPWHDIHVLTVSLSYAFATKAFSWYAFRVLTVFAATSAVKRRHLSFLSLLSILKPETSPHLVVET